MENQIFGSITVLIASLLFYLAFTKYKKEQFNICIFYIMLGGLVLRIFMSCDMYLHEWDERYHALVAKNLLDNPFIPMLYNNPLLDYDYRDWSANHIWVHKQPFPLYSMAASMWLFGVNVIAFRLPSIILSTLAIFSTYKIGEILYSKKVGVLAAFLFAINGLILQQTSGKVATDHIDVFFYSLLSFAILFMLKHSKENKVKFILLGALFTGLAILTKWLPALIVLPIWLIASYRLTNIKTIITHGLIFSLVVMVLVLPWQVYINYRFPIETAWEYLYNKKHIFEVLGNHGHPFYYHFNQMRIIFGEIVYIPLLWLLYITVTKKINRQNLIVLMWILIPYLFFSIVKTKMQGYIMISAPAIFIGIAVFFFYLKKVKLKPTFLVKLIGVLLIALPIRYTIERVKPFNKIERTKPYVSKVIEIDKNEGSKKKVLFNHKYPIETMFHTDFIAYQITPSVSKLKELKQLGYEIYIDNYHSLSDDYKAISYAKFIEISD